MKLLLLDERYPPELLAGFEVVREPQDDVVAVLDDAERARWGRSCCAQLPALRVVGTASVGFDHIDVEAAERAASPSSASRTTAREEVADHTLALLLRAAARDRRARPRRRARRWDAKAAGPLRTLAELRVGIVGLGRIGGAVATRLLALGCRGAGRTTSCRLRATASGSSSWTSCSRSATRSRCTCR